MLKICDVLKWTIRIIFVNQSVSKTFVINK
jgi:hypothetical protein